MVDAQVMLVAMDQRGQGPCEGGADGVRALALLRPVHAGQQGHAVGLLQEIVIAQRMQDQALRVGQDHHVVGVDDLRVQRFHDRQRVVVQHPVLTDDFLQRARRQAAEIRHVPDLQAVTRRAQVRLRDDFAGQVGMGIFRRPAVPRSHVGFKNQAHCLLRCRSILAE